ncbi:MAG: hypothetical protein H6774_03110 [Pseudomonadales bacterium]|nr:hypothetical protein [Candidatus Woesebacteria bacterium]MCB9802053.1 hypothetical protein [Pseudomonadales bacterium]
MPLKPNVEGISINEVAPSTYQNDLLENKRAINAHFESVAQAIVDEINAIRQAHHDLWAHLSAPLSEEKRAAIQQYVATLNGRMQEIGSDALDHQKQYSWTNYSEILGPMLADLEKNASKLNNLVCQLQ